VRFIVASASWPVRSATSVSPSAYAVGKALRHSSSSVPSAATALLGASAGMVGVSRIVATDARQPDTPSPLEVAFTKRVPEEETSRAKLYAELVAELVARSSRGTFIELESVDHTDLLKAGPVLDRLVARIKQLARADAQW
jgi:hypothetical protein